MTEFVLGTVLCDDRSGVTTTNNDDGTVLGGLDVSVEQRLGAFGESRELKHASGTERHRTSISMRVEGSQSVGDSPVPQDSLGLEDGLTVELTTLHTGVKTHPAFWNTLGVGGIPGLG